MKRAKTACETVAQFQAEQLDVIRDLRNQVVKAYELHGIVGLNEHQLFEAVRMETEQSRHQAKLLNESGQMPPLVVPTGAFSADGIEVLDSVLLPAASTSGHESDGVAEESQFQPS